jgi:multiple antibiotic resistance protein
MAQAIVSFFAIIDPLGNILVFHLYSRALTTGQKLIAATLAVFAAWLMLGAFTLGGQRGLDFLGISPESFRIAAGLLLLPAAYRLVMEGQPAVVDEDAALDPLSFALVPLATPLIAGPGALAATTSFAATSGQVTTAAAFTIVLLISLAAFLAAGWLSRVVGAALLRLMARIVGIVLFAIAVEFVLDGLRVFVESVKTAT